MKKKVMGAEMGDGLGALAPGETVLVNGHQWCSLDDWQFEVTMNGETRVISREEADAMFDANATYEVIR